MKRFTTTMVHTSEDCTDLLNWLCTWGSLSQNATTSCRERILIVWHLPHALSPGSVGVERSVAHLC